MQHFQWQFKGKLLLANEITHKTEVLKWTLCNYNNAYILVRCNIAIKGHLATKVAFKNCARFTRCIIKTEGTTIGGAEYLGLVIPM